MNNPRTLLLVALFALSYLIWSQWQLDYNPQAQATTVEDSATPQPAKPAASPPVDDVPEIGKLQSGNAVEAPPLAEATPPTSQPILVTTDVLRVEIDPRGGSLVSAELLAYPQQQGST